MASSASGMCDCVKECTLDELLHQGLRADYDATPTVFGWSTALFELATLAVLVITTMRRKTHPACRRASPALTMLTTISCAAVFGVSWLWADDDISISETLSGAAECNVAEDEEGMTEVKRDGCSSCALRVWLTVYAMTLLWGSVLLRLLRTDAASNTQRRGGSFSRLSSARLLIPFGLGPLLGFQTVVLIIYSAVDAPSLDHVNYPAEMMKTKAHWVCWSESSGAFWTVEFLLGMVLLGYCLKVAKGTQKLVKKNAEVDDEHGVVAKQLSANAGLALVSCVLLAILMSVNDDEYIALACIRTIGLQFFGLGVLISAVVPLALPRGLASIPDDDDEDEDEDNDDEGTADLDDESPTVLPKDMRNLDLSEEMKLVLKAWEDRDKAKTGRSIRGAVSKKKRRYQRDGFDLDLTYITDRIVAMGFPAEGKEATFRNPMAEVQRFLELKHRKHYRIYNLCCEPDRQYDSAKFQDEVALFGFKDHNAPPLPLLLACCQDMDAWLLKDPRNVCAVHCKAGKGRTGTVICAYFAYASQFDTTKDALDYYGRCRTANGKGVTIPSQHRYIHYFAQCMHEGSLREPREIFLTHIHIKGVPEFDPDGGCQPYIIISRATWGNGSNKVEGNEKYGLETVFDSKAALAMVHYRKQKEIEFPPGDDLRLCVPLTGDIFFELKTKRLGSKDKTMCSFWLNTSFLEDGCTVLPKAEIDKCHQDMKKHSKFEKDFAITLRYSTTPLEAFAERAAGGPRRAGPGTQSSVAMPTFDVEEAAPADAVANPLAPAKGGQSPTSVVEI